MKIIQAGLACVLTFFLIHESVAGLDPVSWSLRPQTGFEPVGNNRPSIVSYTLSNRLPISATIRTSFVTTVEAFTIQDHCSNISLLPGSSCDIEIRFHHEIAEKASIQLIYGYDLNNIIYVPPLHTPIVRNI